MKHVSKTITSRVATEEQILSYLEVHHPDLKASIEHPPDWVAVLSEHYADTTGWSTVGRQNTMPSIWNFLRDAHDIEHLRTLQSKPIAQPADVIPVAINKFAELNIDDPVIAASAIATDPEDAAEDDMYECLFAAPARESWEEMSDSDVSDDNSSVSEDGGASPQKMPSTRSPAEIIQDREAFLEFFDFKTLPRIPATARHLDVLLHDGDAWTFSVNERNILANHIASRAKTDVDEDSLAQFEGLARKHEEARKLHDQAKDNIRVAMLRGIKLLGSTTTGAAKLPSVLKGFSPKVLVIEEVGQVLEAHVLATLFPTIQHVIAIGDPLQLRPNVNSYELSVDSPRGDQLFRFDVSLMERLSAGGLAMSQLQVQRRMRPEISSLIRLVFFVSWSISR